MTKELAINILRGDVLGTDEQTHEAVFMAIKALKEQERVDAVEVVRCKDCKYHKQVDWGMGDCEYPNGFKWIAYDNDFCSRGERRTDETD